MSYVNASQTRDYTKPPLRSVRHTQFLKTLKKCTYHVCFRALDKSKYAAKAGILLCFCGKGPSFEAALSHVRMERLAHTKHLRGGGERDCGKVTGYPLFGLQ